MTVKVINHKYEINFVHPQSSELSGGDRIGSCNILTKTIAVSNVLNSLMTKEVLIHELTHAFVYESGLRKEEYSEEDLCLFNERWLIPIMDIVVKVLP